MTSKIESWLVDITNNIKTISGKNLVFCCCDMGEGLCISLHVFSFVPTVLLEQKTNYNFCLNKKEHSITKNQNLNALIKQILDECFFNSSLKKTFCGFRVYLAKSNNALEYLFSV